MKTRRIGKSMSLIRLSGAVAGCALLAALAGCGGARLGGEASPYRGGVADKDKVLWQYRGGLNLLRKGDYAEAKANFDDALARIGNIMGNDPSARKARGYFNAESKKTFIGEPYERAMAYYYRGILYWMDGELDNARACFRSAALEDSGTADEQYSSDYVLFDYLDGLATQKLAGDGSDALKRASTAARISTPPPYNSKANLLLFVDFGSGPTKYSAGRYGEHLMFRHGLNAARSVQVQFGGQTYQLRPYDDLYFQATTRGGRVMDHILANKAAFKTGTDIAGDAALITGGVLATTDKDTQAVGAGLLAAGLISKIVSASTTPTADTRSWDNLPMYLSFAAFELPPGQHTLTVDFLDQQNRKISGCTKTVTIEVSAGTDKVVYVSDKS